MDTDDLDTIDITLDMVTIDLDMSHASDCMRYGFEIGAAMDVPCSCSPLVFESIVDLDLDLEVDMGDLEAPTEA